MLTNQHTYGRELPLEPLLSHLALHPPCRRLCLDLAAELDAKHKDLSTKVAKEVSDDAEYKETTDWLDEHRKEHDDLIKLAQNTWRHLQKGKAGDKKDDQKESRK